MTNLKAELRDASAKLGDLRKSGYIPAVFYGKKQESTPISIKMVDFMKAFKEAGESSVISLDTGSETVECLIHDVDFDPVLDTPRHVDFYVFEKGHKVEVEVPIEFEGVSPAVKDLGGTLVKVLYDLKIEAMPKDLPHNVVADISALVDFNAQITVKDIKLPTGVTALEDADEVVALVSAPRDEKEEVSAPLDLDAIEVEKKGKDESAEEAGAGEEASA